MNKSIKQKIRKDIIKEIDYLIDKFDIDREIKKFDIKGEVAELIREKINEQIANKIELAIYNKVQQIQPLIDAFTADTVTAIMMKFDKFINNNE